MLNSVLYKSVFKNFAFLDLGVLPGAFIAEDNAMTRFKKFKLKEYNKFVEKLPGQRMPNSEEYIEIFKLLSSQESKIFCGSMIPLDTGQGITI